MARSTADRGSPEATVRCGTGTDVRRANPASLGWRARTCWSEACFRRLGENPCSGALRQQRMAQRTPNPQVRDTSAGICRKAQPDTEGIETPSRATSRCSGGSASQSPVRHRGHSKVGRDRFQAQDTRRQRGCGLPTVTVFGGKNRAWRARPSAGRGPCGLGRGCLLDLPSPGQTCMGLPCLAAGPRVGGWAAQLRAGACHQPNRVTPASQGEGVGCLACPRRLRSRSRRAPQIGTA